MKHIIHGAYKDALKHLKHDMKRRMLGMKDKDEEEEMEGENPEEEAMESPEEEKIEHRLEDGELTTEEKRESMYPKRKRKAGPSLMVLAMGKKSSPMPKKGR